ncbi:aldose 1-epimerase family protein [Flavobacterium sp.]
MKTTISNSKLSATINHKGAELVSLFANGTDKEYIWEGNSNFWGKHSPILFPIVGTLKNNSYRFDGKQYELSRHGFAREMDFELIINTGKQAVFLLKSDAGTKMLFPFDFELHIYYSLNDHKLDIRYKVINTGNQLMYFSIGGHPAFALPNHFEKYSLKFEANEKLISYQLEDGLLSEITMCIDLTEGKLPLNYSIFEKDALIFKHLESNRIQLLENNRPILNFEFTDFPNFGIWTIQNAPFLCLEPWAGYSDLHNTTGDIVNKEGIQQLNSKHSKEYGFSIEIL